MRLGFVVVFLLALLCAGVVQAEPFLVWNKTFTDCEPGGAYSVVPSGDGGFVIYGYMYTSTDRGTRNTTLLKVDSEGNKVWEHYYSRKGPDGRDIAWPNDFSSQALVQSGDGGFVVTAGSCPKPTHSLSEYCDMYLFKVDANGDMVWEKTYPSSDASCIIQSGDGGFIISGTITLLPSPMSYTVSYAMKIDSEGNTVWDKTYPGMGVSCGITESGDGGYFFLDAANGGPTIMKVDSEGNTIWYKNYPSKLESRPYAFTRTDEGFIVVGYQYEGASMKENLYLLSVDQDGNKSWERTYSKTLHLEARDVIPDGDGFIVAGTYDQLELPWGNVYLLKIDSYGNMIWETTIPYCKDANAITESGDGGFVIVGPRYCLSDQEVYVAKIKGTPPWPMPEFPFGIVWFIGVITASIGCNRKTRHASGRFLLLERLDKARITTVKEGGGSCG